MGLSHGRSQVRPSTGQRCGLEPQSVGIVATSPRELLYRLLEVAEVVEAQWRTFARAMHLSPLDVHPHELCPLTGLIALDESLRTSSADLRSNCMARLGAASAPPPPASSSTCSLGLRLSFHGWSAVYGRTRRSSYSAQSCGSGTWNDSRASGDGRLLVWTSLRSRMTGTST